MEGIIVWLVICVAGWAFLAQRIGSPFVQWDFTTPLLQMYNLAAWLLAIVTGVSVWLIVQPQ